MTEIYLIRHAQSLGNETGRYLGHTNLGLSNLGKNQALMLSGYLKTLKIDKIYSSSLIRAVETISPFAKERGLGIIKDDEIREIYAGKWENMKFDDLEIMYPEEYGNVWRNNVGLAKCPCGESMADVQKRVCKRIGEICTENNGKTVAIVSHGAAIRAFMCKSYSMPLEKMKDIAWVSNASVTHIFYENGEYEFDFVSYDDFLGDMISSLPRNV